MPLFFFSDARQIWRMGGTPIRKRKEQMHIKFLGLVAALGLVACGQTDLERGLSGAAAGAITAEVLGESPVTGAAIGGAAGVLCDDAGLRACN